MKIWKLICLGITLCLLSCNTDQATDKKEITETDKLALQLDEYFSTLAHIDKFNGGVYIKRDGATILRKAYNIKTDSNDKLFATVDAQFDIHSISKLMAKACIVKLESDNLINRNDKLSKYLPDFPRGDEISMEMLLKNSSGLPRRLSDKPKDLMTKSPEELVELIKKEKLVFEPGSETLYSNLGYQLLYFVIAKVTKKPFVQYVNDEFFVPLNMNDSGAHFHLEKNNIARMVHNHEYDDGKIVTVPNMEPDGKNQARIYSTMDDLMSFIDLVKESPYRSKLKNKSGNVGWSGGGDGILTHANAALSSNYEFTLFSNFDEIPFGKILEDVEKIMTNQPYELPKEINRKEVELPKELMQQYVGKYNMAEFNQDEFEIRIEDEDFVFYQNGERNTILYAENDSTLFFDPKFDDCFIFRKDGADAYKLIFLMKGVEIEGKRK